MENQHLQKLWSDLWHSRFADDRPRLRFELGGEEFDNISQMVPRFLQAHRRASTVADQMFCDDCVAVVACHPADRSSNDDLPSGDTNFEALADTGFRNKHMVEWEADLYPDPENEPNIWQLRAYAIGRDKVARDILVWHSIAVEMPIAPKVTIATFLIEPSQHVMMHIYDDRGMDIMAVSGDELLPYYRQFDDWLLDYDRQRMAKMFN